MSAILDRIYSLSPRFIQNIGVTLYGYYWKKRRFGGQFSRYVSEFIGRDFWSKSQWDEYQTNKLRELLSYAVENVPYYRESIPKSEILGIDLSDLHKLPILEKETVRRDPVALAVAPDKRRSGSWIKTSGTTGTPLSILYTDETHRRISASYEARVRRWAGVDHTMSRMMIGGRLVVPRAATNPPFWRYNAAERQLYMSAFHISRVNTPAYVEAINKYKPDYLVGYASAHYFLSRFINELKLNVYRPKAILTSSEKLTTEMRECLETAYNAPVFDGYSGVEACSLASECEHHRLHVSPDVGIIELIGEDGKPVAIGQIGEIVATGFLNYEQPLIRYRTGDYALQSDKVCPCGREMPVLDELVGRLEDTVISPNGSEMVRFHGIFVGLPNVIQGQIIQETISDIRLKLVVADGYGDTEKKTIAKRFEERLGQINLIFEYVDEIERTHGGKYRAVISKVKRSEIQ